MPEIETLAPEMDWPGTSLADYLLAAGVGLRMAESGVVDADGTRWTRVLADRDVTELLAAFVSPAPAPDPVAQLQADVLTALAGTAAQKAEAVARLKAGKAGKAGMLP